MSYDLMVFEKTKAPGTKNQFLAWYENQVKWEEDHDYETISTASPALQSWFMEIKDSFPPMNGEFAPDEDSDSRTTDYCIGRDMIYASFSWSAADEAYELVRKLAQKHDVGFFNASGHNAEIILPDGSEIK